MRTILSFVFIEQISIFSDDFNIFSVCLVQDLKMEKQ